MMEEYLRKQKEKMGSIVPEGTSGSPPKKEEKPQAKKQDFSESSDRYEDDEFESYSKSQS